MTSQTNDTAFDTVKQGLAAGAQAFAASANPINGASVGADNSRVYQGEEVYDGWRKVQQKEWINDHHEAISRAYKVDGKPDKRFAALSMMMLENTERDKATKAAMSRLWLQMASGVDDKYGRVYFGESGDDEQNFERIRAALNPEKYESPLPTALQEFEAMPEEEQNKVVADYYQSRHGFVDPGPSPQMMGQGFVATSTVTALEDKPYSDEELADYKEEYRQELKSQDHTVRMRALTNMMEPHAIEFAQATIESGEFDEDLFMRSFSNGQQKLISHYLRANREKLSPNFFVEGAQRFGRAFDDSVKGIARGLQDTADPFFIGFSQRAEDLGLIPEGSAAEFYDATEEDKSARYYAEQAQREQYKERSFGQSTGLAAIESAPYSLALLSGKAIPLMITSMAKQKRDELVYEYDADPEKAYFSAGAYATASVLSERLVVSKAVGRGKSAIDLMKNKQIKNAALKAGNSLVKSTGENTAQEALDTFMDEMATVLPTEGYSDEAVRDALGNTAKALPHLAGVSFWMSLGFGSVGAAQQMYQGRYGKKGFRPLKDDATDSFAIEEMRKDRFQSPETGEALTEDQFKELFTDYRTATTKQEKQQVASRAGEKNLKNFERKLAKEAEIYQLADQIAEEDFLTEQDALSREDTEDLGTFGNARIRESDNFFQVRKIQEQFQASGKAAPLRFVDRAEELPENITAQVDDPSLIEGYFDPESQEVVLVSENITSPDRAMEVWAEEQVGHFANQQQGLEDLRPIIEQAGLSEDQLRESLGEGYQGLSGDALIDEYSAKIARNVIDGKTLTVKEQSVWEKIKQWFKDTFGLSDAGPQEAMDRAIAELMIARAKRGLQSSGETGQVQVTRKPRQLGEQSGNTGELPDNVVEIDFSQPRFSLAENPEQARQIEEEMAAIEQRAKADGTWLKAPNGKDSNLNPHQWKQVRTTAFKNWFGDWENDPENASKVIDDNGEPMVVYHGTDAYFTEFSDQRSAFGFFFAPDFGTAGGYATSGSDNDLQENSIFPVFLNIKNLADFEEGKTFEKVAEEAILDLDEERSQSDVQRFFEGILNSKIVELPQVKEWLEDFINTETGEIESIPDDIDISMLGDSLKDAVPNFMEVFDREAPIRSGAYEQAQLALGSQEFYLEYQDDFMRAAITLGFDGVLFPDPSEYGIAQSYVAFSPSQIKSAIGNQGTFDADNPDIRFSLRQETTPKRNAAIVTAKRIFNGWNVTIDDVKREGDFDDAQARRILIEAENIAKMTRQDLERLGDSVVLNRRLRANERKIYRNRLQAAFKSGTNRGEMIEKARARMADQRKKSRAEELANRPGIEQEDVEAYWIAGRDFIASPRKRPSATKPEEGTTEQEEAIPSPIELAKAKYEKGYDGPKLTPEEWLASFKDTIRDGMVRRGDIKPGTSVGDAMKTPEFKEDFRKSASSLLGLTLHEIPNQLDRIKVQERIRKIKKTRNQATMDNLLLQGLTIANTSRVKEDKSTLVKALKKVLKPFTKKPADREEQKERKADFYAHERLYYANKVMKMTRDELEKERERLGRDAQTFGRSYENKRKEAVAQDDQAKATWQLEVFNYFNAITKQESTPAQVAEALRFVEEVRKQGESEVEQVARERQERLDPIVENVEEDVREAQNKIKIKPKKKRFSIGILSTATMNINQRLQDLVRYGKGKSLDFIEKIAENINQATQEYHKSMIRDIRAFHNIVSEIWQDGNFETVMGNLTRLRKEYAKYSPSGRQAVSKSYLIQVVGVLDMKFYRDLANAKNDDGSAVNPGLAKALKQLPEIRRNLTGQDMQLLEWFRDYYFNKRGELSPVVKELMGFEITNTEINYIPYKAESQMSGPNQAYHGVEFLPGFTESRVRHGRAPDPSMGIIELFLSRVEDQNHFIHFGVLNTEIRGAFMRDSTRRLISDTYGDDYENQLNDHLVDIMNGKPMKVARNDFEWLDVARAWMAYSKMGFNIISGGRQLMGVQNLPLELGWLGLGKAIKNLASPQGLSDMLVIAKSPNMRARLRFGFMEAVTNALEYGRSTSGTKGVRHVVKFFKSGMMVPQLNDAIASTVVGAGVYRTYLNDYLQKGHSQAEAERMATNKAFGVIERTQQSSNMKDMATWLRTNNSTVKSVAQFTSAITQLYSYEAWAVRQAKADPTPKKLARLTGVLFTNHVFIPAGQFAIKELFDGFFDDEDDEIDYDQLLGMMLAGPASGLVLLGTLAEAVGNAAVTGRFDIFASGTPVGGIIDDSQLAMQTARNIAIGDEDELFDAVWETLKKIFPAAKQQETIWTEED